MSEENQVIKEIANIIYKSMACETPWNQCCDAANTLYNTGYHKQSEVERAILRKAASKFSGHSDYHGDAILCKLICMSEGKEVKPAEPIDEVRRKETKADTLQKIKVQLALHFGTYTDKDEVKVSEVFKLIDQITSKILEVG